MDKLKIVYLDENPDVEYKWHLKSNRIIPLKTKSGVEFGWVDPGIHDNECVQILIDRSMLKD